MIFSSIFTHSSKKRLCVPNIMKSVFFQQNLRHLIVIFLTCLFFLSLILLFSGNFLILGGEGNYFTDFGLTKKVGSHAWVSINAGTGYPNPTNNGLVFLFDILAGMQNIGISLKVINILIVFANFMLPFLTMIWLLRRVLKYNFLVSYIISLFYILNPFSTYHLQGIMFWNTAPLFVMPLFFGLIYTFYFEKIKLFLYFGLLSSVLAFSFSNIPYLGIFHMFVLISVALIYFMKSQSLKNKSVLLILRNFLIVETSFILFNLWWLLNLLRFQSNDLGTYTTKFAVGIAKIASGGSGIMLKIFNLTMLVTLDKGNFFSDFYNSIPMNVLLFIPFFILIWGILTSTITRDKKNEVTYTIIVFFILVVLFFTKGVNEPIKDWYVWMMENVPFFLIFKSPLEKFSVLFIFLVSIALADVFKNTKSRWPYMAMILYLVACSLPYLTLKFVPDVQFEKGKYISRKYIYHDYFENTRRYLNEDKLDSRLLILPGSLNYQVTVLNHNQDKYYRGHDPLIYSVDKPFIAAYTAPGTNFDLLFSKISQRKTRESLLDIYNIKRVVINKDIYPAFGFKEKENLQRLDKVFSTDNNKVAFDSFQIYTRPNFLPHFYIPSVAFPTSQKPDQLAKIVAHKNYDQGTAIFFRSQNSDKNVDSLTSTHTNKPYIEFRKINPIKYRVIIHKAKNAFPLIFSESYHDGWKVYPDDTTLSHVQSSERLQSDVAKNYKILQNNEDHQATKQELVSYLQEGLISDLGNGEEKQIIHYEWNNGMEHPGSVEHYYIDFVSKQYRGTIQNDNLAKGSFFDTWGKKTLPEKDHLVANGYANSWIIRPDDICSYTQHKQSIKCQKNSDDTYDIELIVEFSPQRLIYAGIIISSLFFLTALLIAIIETIRQILLWRQSGSSGSSKIILDGYNSSSLKSQRIDQIPSESRRKLIMGILLFITYAFSRTVGQREYWFIMQLVIWFLILLQLRFFTLIFAHIKKSVQTSPQTRSTMLRRIMLIIIWDIGIIMMRRVGISNIFLDAGTIIFLMHIPIIWLLRASATVSALVAFGTMMLAIILYVNDFPSSAEVISIYTYYLLLTVVIQKLSQFVRKSI